jgi:hypothetical protein
MIDWQRALSHLNKAESVRYIFPGIRGSTASVPILVVAVWEGSGFHEHLRHTTYQLGKHTGQVM